MPPRVSSDSSGDKGGESPEHQPETKKHPKGKKPKGKAKKTATKQEDDEEHSDEPRSPLHGGDEDDDDDQSAAGGGNGDSGSRFKGTQKRPATRLVKSKAPTKKPAGRTRRGLDFESPLLDQDQEPLAKSILLKASFATHCHPTFSWSWVL